MRHHDAHLVEVVARVHIKRHTDAVFPQSSVKTKVKLVLLLIGQSGVTHLRNANHGLSVLTIDAERIACTEHRGRTAVRRIGRSTCQTIRPAEGEARERTQTIEEIFLVQIPRAREVPSRHPARIAVASHLVRTLIAVSAIKNIATAIRIAHVGVERHRAPVGVGQRIVVFAVLDTFLQILINVERHFTRVVLHTPTLKTSACAQEVGHFRTTKEVDGVFLCKSARVSCRSTEVVVAHAVLILVINTTDGQHRHGQIIGMFRIAIEIAVAVTNDCIRHRAIGHRLVRVFRHVVFLRRCSILKSTESCQLQTCDRLIFQFKLELRIEHIQVDEVVVQFIENVEWCIVRHIVSVWIEHTRSVQSIRIGVDVEIAFHLTIHHIHVLSQRARRALFAVRSTTNHIERQVLEQMLCHVEVRSVAVHLTLFVPTWIQHRTHRSIVI